MNRVFVVILTGFLLFSNETFAQSPYSLNWKTETVVYALGMGTMTGAWLKSRQVEPLTIQEINELNPEKIRPFDRFATENYSRRAKITSDVLMVGSYLTPLSLMLDPQKRPDAITLAVMGAETYLLVSGVTQLTKNLTLRNRPFVYNPEADLEDKQKKDARYSFFSGHTSTAAAATFFWAKVYSDYHPDGKWKPMIWGAAIAIPALTGYMRVKAGKHFPTDVITGYAVGALCGYLIPELHKGKKPEGLGFVVGPNGAHFCYQF